MHLAPDIVRTPLQQAYESYNNPRLENDGETYFTPEHIEALKLDSEIIVWDEYAQSETIKGIGTLRRIGIRTRQGYTYDTLIGIPEHPTCDVPVIGTTAWTTSLHGHNERTVRNLMKNGNYVIYVGAEGSFDDGQQIPPSSPISLAGSAAAVLNFSYHMVNELRKEGHNVHEELRFVVGESRGGMIAEGIDALAEEFAQKVIFSDQIAPCLPEKLRGLAEALRLAEQIAKEPIEMYRLLGRLTMARLRYYPRTLDLRASNIYHQIIIGGALFGGETGYMSRHTPDTTLKHLLLFENDFASKHGWWERRYQENPLVHTTPMPGSHLTIADPETLRFVLARNTAAQLFVNSGRQLDTRVFDLSHLIVQHKEHALLEAA